MPGYCVLFSIDHPVRNTGIIWVDLESNFFEVLAKFLVL
jgi:hypothetical protein